jgi:hypothetical protein
MDLYDYFEKYYPVDWEREYKKFGTVNLWHKKYPELFKWYLKDYGGLADTKGTLGLFAQYALMFLLRDQEGVNSITWYEIAYASDNWQKSKNLERREFSWGVMKKWMGVEKFNELRKQLNSNEFTDQISGEPDLFCWNPKNAQWFFAEAKGKDNLHEKQLKWFKICKKALGKLADIRVYRVVPK